MLGLRTAIYLVPDMQKAREWYARAFNTQPYFDEPSYIGFNIGGYELGLFPQQSAEKDNITPAATGNTDTGNPGNTAPDAAPADKKQHGVLTYWGVEDIRKEHARLLELGARPCEKITNVGGDILIAAVLDPFGNILGLIQNPHFKT